jgi:hypothetical protein
MGFVAMISPSGGTSSELDAVGDLGVPQCDDMINSQARGYPAANAVVEVSVVPPYPFR